jgi:hypothetical protein
MEMVALILALHLVVIIIVVREFKRYHDRKCQENFDCGMMFGKLVSNAINRYEEE